MDYASLVAKCKTAIANAGDQTELYINLGFSNTADDLCDSLRPLGWEAYYDGEGFYTLKKL